jgi:hypothetical protein
MFRKVICVLVVLLSLALVQSYSPGTFFVIYTYLSRRHVSRSVGFQYSKDRSSLCHGVTI